MIHNKICADVFLHVWSFLSQNMQLLNAFEDILAGPESQRRHKDLTPNAATQHRKESEIVGATGAD